MSIISTESTLRHTGRGEKESTSLTDSEPWEETTVHKPVYVLDAEGVDEYDLVLVEWEDANSIPGWFVKVPESPCLPCVSVGYVVKETKRFITLAHTLNAAGMFGDLFSIPKGCVKSKKILVKRADTKKGK